jgi:hypothetical protein
MQFTLIVPVLTALLFGLVVAGVFYLIVGWSGWRAWLGGAWVLACLCYIVLFGVIRV